MVKYFVGHTELEKKKIAERFSPCSNKRVDIQCPDCKKVTRNYLIGNLSKNHFSCACKDGHSYPEKYMISVLEQLKIMYEYQKIFSWCKFYNPYTNKNSFGRYDFYIPSKNLIVEMDGGYGHGNNIDTYEKDIYIDKKKDDLAAKHGITIVRIDCKFSESNYIKNSIYNSILNDIFNLSSVDFSIANKYAISNIAYDVVKFYMKNREMSAKQISDIFNLSITTVLRYLKSFNIRYDNHIGSKGKHNFKNSKPVIIDDIIYNSVYEAKDYIESVYRISVNTESLLNAIRNGKTYKGITCSYIQ